MNHVGLFAGIGGFELAGQRVGFTPTLLCEIEGRCNRVLEARFPGVSRHADVATLDAPTGVDLLTGGSPCQGFSVAGARRGMADERSALFAHFVRILEGAKPRCAVWENVPGALTSNKGEDFANVLAALTGSSEPLWLPPHKSGRRSRPAGIAGGPRASVAWRVLDARYFGVPQRRQRIFAVVGSDPFDALFPGFDADALPGEPDAYSTDAYAMCLDIDLPFETGPAPLNPVERHVVDVLELEVPAYYYLSSRACKGILERASRHGHRLPELLERALRHQEINTSELPERALRQPAETYRKVRRAQSKEDYETWERCDTTNTLNLFDNGGDVRATDLVVEVPGYRVRRLTPREGERLQGFPDDWTAVDGAKDGPRYSQVGNAVAVPCAEWVLGRVAGLMDTRDF